MNSLLKKPPLIISINCNLEERLNFYDFTFRNAKVNSMVRSASYNVIVCLYSKAFCFVSKTERGRKNRKN